MAQIGYIKKDFIKTYSQARKNSRRKQQLVFGDKVEILEFQDGWTRLKCLDSYDVGERWVKGSLELMEKGVLKISMVDVQQGDGMIIETPEGKIVFLDGGDNKLFARHAAARYQYKNSSKQSPMEVDAIIVTHGDADHFHGLNEFVVSEKNKVKRKQIFIKPKRIYHNGLTKSPAKINNRTIPDIERLGRTIEKDGSHFITDLYDDTRDTEEINLNSRFKSWHESINHWEKTYAYSVEMKRLAYGMDEASIFDFLYDEEVKIELLGPFTDKLDINGNEIDALPFFHKHSDGSMIHLENDLNQPQRVESASHTINGHSISFRLTYGNVRILFTGDLNEEALKRMMDRVDANSKLPCEVFKAPHHGSHDFSVGAIRKAAPIISIVSSGDESTFHEHIHPRATLLAALGNNSRTDMGVIFITELAAFFHKKDECYTRKSLAEFFKDTHQEQFTKKELEQLFKGVPRREDPPGMFYGFERTNFGIIHLRTDGKKILAFTHSGKEGMNEAYSYTINDNHEVTSNRIYK